MGLALVVLRGEGPNRAVLRPTRASLQAVRGGCLRCASGTSHSIIAMIKDLVLEAIGLRYSRMNGRVLVDGCDCESLRLPATPERGVCRV